MELQGKLVREIVPFAFGSAHRGRSLGHLQRLKVKIPMQRLLQMQLISPPAYDLFLSLYRARNAAARAGTTEITPCDAFEYRENAELLKTILTGAINRLKQER
jgi:hypothetical protein